MQFRLVLDTERREVRIGREVACCAQSLEQPKEQLGVPVTWMQDGNGWPRQPGADVAASDRDTERARKNLPMRG